MPIDTSNLTPSERADFLLLQKKIGKAKAEIRMRVRLELKAKRIALQILNRSKRLKREKYQKEYEVSNFYHRIEKIKREQEHPGYKPVPDILSIHVDLNEVSKKFKIPHWQCNKIRALFKKKLSGSGYPSRLWHNVKFASSGLSLWIPQFYTPDEELTWNEWHSNPREMIFREVIIVKTKEIPGYNAENMILDTLARLPLGIGHIFIGFIDDFRRGLSKVRWNVFSNLAFYNTIGNDVIKRNWDHVLRWLNINGY